MNDMTHPLLFIVVLNNKQRYDTRICLSSLRRSNYDNFKVLLLDSVSASDPDDEIGREFPEVQIISLSENQGYAGNNNIGIQAALKQGAEWIFLLNDDTVLDPACLSALIEAGESDPQIGIVGPMVYHFDEPSIIQSAGGMLARDWKGVHIGIDEQDRGQYRSVREVEWISGCAILVRRAVIEQVGALDPDYFLYVEETEWCIRARRAGWKIVHVPHAKLWHKGVKRNYLPQPYVTYYVTRNHLRTLAKHNAPLSIKLLALFNIFRTLMSWSIKPRWKDKHEHRNAMWRGLLDFLKHRYGPMLP